ncbi:MAG: cysteine desulfurase family protein [Flavobacteriales bacterium]
MMEKKQVYLDNAATTPIDPLVIEAMMPWFKEHHGNPSSTHAFGRKTKTAIEQARRSIAKALNCSPSEIYFTSGGTEADNLAMHIALGDLGCTHIITSAIEHSAVIKTAQMMEEQGRAKLSLVALNPDGHINLEDLERLLQSHEKSFVTLMHGNNEIANLLPLKEVSELCVKYNAVFHSDTVQTMGHYRFNLAETPIHFLNASAHKFHGPKGIGFIYINKIVQGHADVTGGGQERGMRGGTENIYGIVGMARALELCHDEMEEHHNYVLSLKRHMAEALENRFPGVRFNGDSRSENSLYTVLNVTLPETSQSDMMLFLLDLEGVACSGGSACSSGATKGSHVLDAIGALIPHCPSIRFSFSRLNTKAEIDWVLERMEQCYRMDVLA